MTTIQVCPSCTLEALIDQEGLHFVLDTIYDLANQRLGEDMEWDDPMLYNDPKDVEKMFKAILKASIIAQGV